MVVVDTTEGLREVSQDLAQGDEKKVEESLDSQAERLLKVAFTHL